MNEVQVIDQREVLGKDFKIYGTFENPLFLAKNVAEWIDYTKTGQGYYDVAGMLRTVEEEEKIKSTINNRSVWFLTEDGLYEVLMQSRKPIAKAFKKQVKQILKDIRKHGMYARDELLNNPDLLIQVATELKKEREEKRLLQEEIRKNASKVAFARLVSSSQNLMLVREVAKLASDEGVKIGEKRLWNKLREWGFVCKNSTEARQIGIERGFFKVVESTHSNSKGTFTHKTTKVTGKGQLYIITRLIKEFQEVA